MFRTLRVGFHLASFLLFKKGKLRELQKLKETQPVKAEEEALEYVRKALKTVLDDTGSKVDVIGLENVPKDQAVLYVGNHRSYFDVVTGYVHAPGRLGFVAKEEMQKVPIFADWMSLVGCVFLNRKNPREGLKAILQAIANVKNGSSMWIFPEGTRSKGSELDLLPFHDGSLKIADKAKCPIVPVAFTGTTEVFERQFPRVKPGHITVHFGKPFYMSDLTPEQKKTCGAYTRDLVLELLREDLGMTEKTED